MTAKSCCLLSEFMDDFNHYWQQYFKTLPAEYQIKAAKRDWGQGNTGWEAVQIAKERIDEAAIRAASKPLVNIGGNNYAHEGSELALRYGSRKP